MTVENCKRLAKICRDNNDEAGALMYEARALRKDGKKERLIAIDQARIKQLQNNEEARLQELEQSVGIDVRVEQETSILKKDKPKEKKDGKTTKRSGN